MNSTPSYSLQKFNKLLCTADNNTAFYTYLAYLLEEDPFFAPAYLEMMWFAEERDDVDMYKKVLLTAVENMRRIFSDREKMHQISSSWSQVEYEACLKIFEIAQRSVYSPFSLRKKPALFLFSNYLRMFVRPTVKLSDTDGKYLKRIKTVDPNRFIEELSVPPHWWQIDTMRSETITHHQHTRSIVLRQRSVFNEEYEAVDGVHESSPTDLVGKFPKIHELSLELAKELGIGLGRVVLVMSRPKSQVYRHRDRETFLKNRKRYHLVLASGDYNYLESGTDSAYVKPGELWFFDNKVLHRAYNGSDTNRIHLIFDGYPLDETSPRQTKR